MSGLNRINIVIPGSSSTAAAQRDEVVTKLIALPLAVDLYSYSDTVSGNGGWGYYAYGYGLSSGTITIATVRCVGMAHPPSGSDLQGFADPGPGITYTWTALGSPHSIMTSGGGGGSAPAQNSNYWTWNIPGNSPTAPADFTAAITHFLQFVDWSQYYKYVDSVSGAWAVYGVGMTGGTTGAGGSPIPLNCLIVTCSGTPNPPRGSPFPAVAIPAFTQTFVTLSAPLSIYPSR